MNDVNGHTQLEPSSVIDCHVHVGLKGDSFGMGAFSDYFTAQPAFKVFLAYARLRGRPATDAVLHEATLAVLAGCHLNGVVCLALDPVYDPDGTRREDRSHMWVDNAYVCRLRDELPDKVLPGASVHPYRRDFADEVRHWVDQGAMLLKWLPSAQAIDLAEPAVGARMRELAHLGPGGGPLPLLLHVGCEYAIPNAAPANSLSRVQERAGVRAESERGGSGASGVDPSLSSLNFLSWSAWDRLGNGLRDRKAWLRPRVREIEANLRAAASEGAIIIFAHLGLPYFASGLLAGALEHSDFDVVQSYLKRGSEREGDRRRYFADISACCTPFRKPYFKQIAALPRDALLLGSDFPTPIFELSADLKHNLADLRAAMEGEPERLIVPEGNLLDVNRAEHERAFSGHPMFTNLGELCWSASSG
ncbi:MAG TPA: hypothetical protein VMT19_03810 [Thermoanaerobaculaceae bacterium]|nr:hypothetical protein [Thermoanaerobaculaceae bacterium]